MKKEVLQLLAAGSLIVSGCVSKTRENTSGAEVLKGVPTPAGIVNEGGQTYLDNYDNVYDQTTQRAIDKAEAWGIEIISPDRWSHDGQLYKSLPWNKEEVEIIEQALLLLPPAYFTEGVAPSSVILAKFKEWSGSAYGGYAEGSIQLIISGDFEAEGLPRIPVGTVCPTWADYLRFMIIHEWTHALTEARPTLLLQWIDQTGWLKDASGNWSNDLESEIYIFHKVKEPVEDFAVSAALYLINPSLLSEKRRNFFASSSYFSMETDLVRTDNLIKK